MASMTFTYASGETPEHYVCSKCGASKCKLWRQYQTFADNIKLLCQPCAEADQGRKLILAGPDRSDTIGWLVPAVPTEDGDTYWGYTSVPEPGVVWWKGLAGATV